MKIGIRNKGESKWHNINLLPLKDLAMDHKNGSIMKKIFLNILAILMSATLSYTAQADCDYSKIVKNNDSTYTYSAELHVCVGKMKQDLTIANEQNDKLIKALDLKDLTIAKADQRSDLWQAATFKLEDRINTIDQMRSTNQYLAFGLGALTMFAAVYAASQLTHH